MKSLFAGLSLQKKVIAIIVMTTLTATLTVIPTIFSTLRSGMQGQRQRHLTGVRHLVERLLEDNRRTVRNYAALFSTDRQVKDNLYYYAELAGERIHPLNAIQHLVLTFGLQFIELGDRYGKVVVDTSKPNQYDHDKSADNLIRAALDGNVVTGIESYEEGFFLKAVAPIHHDEGQLIGTMTTGMTMDNDFAGMIKLLSGVEIAIIDQNSRVVASTLPESPQTDNMSATTISMFHDGKHYQVMSLPFQDNSGQPLGSVIIMAEDILPGILQRANLTVILILLCVSIISIGITVFMLRRVLSPIRELREGAEKIGRGEFGHRLIVASTDEIGSLTQVFNTMAANLQQMREVEEKLKHAERLASIGEFTAATAHELNNPIANIIGLSKVLRKEITGVDNLAEDLDLIAKEANRCGAIVRDLLVYSRPSRPNRERVDLNRLIEESINAMGRRYLADRDIKIRFDRLNPDEAHVNIDPAQIEQVFRNLLINGIQSISGQGILHIKARRDEPDSVTISFTDTGCGIKKEHLDKIFYPFFTTKKTGEGTGLGLAVCYTIVQSHGGNIAVTSQEKGGSVFTITLPTAGAYNE